MHIFAGQAFVQKNLIFSCENLYWNFKANVLRNLYKWEAVYFSFVCPNGGCFDESKKACVECSQIECPFPDELDPFNPQEEKRGKAMSI